MKLRINYLFIALFGLSTSVVYASPIVSQAQAFLAQAIPGLHTLQGLLAPLGLINPTVEVDTDHEIIHDTGIQHSYHLHESEGHHYPIALAGPHHLTGTSVIVEEPVVVEEKKSGKLLKLLGLLWRKTLGKKSHKSLHKTKEIVETEPIIVQQQVPVYITKHVGVPQPYPVTKTIVKEVKVPQPYPVTKTLVKEIPVPQPYPVTKTVVKEVKVPEPYPVTKTLVKEVAVPQPYPVTKTLVKEVPVVHKVKEFVPFKISVPEPVPVPFIKTVKEHHVLQPIVEKKTIIEHHQPSPTLPPTPAPEPDIVVEEDKAVITPSVPMTEKSIEIIPQPQPAVEYGLPPVKSFQPFNEYELPAHGSDIHGGKFDKSNGEGEYISSYVLNDGTKVSEEGHLIKGKMGNDVLVKKGNYEYTDKNGKEIKVDWIADELGFRVLNEK